MSTDVKSYNRAIDPVAYLRRRAHIFASKLGDDMRVLPCGPRALALKGVRECTHPNCYGCPLDRRHREG